MVQAKHVVIGSAIVLGVLIIAGVVVMRMRSSRSSGDALHTKIIEQSKQYVETLGSEPFETLTSAKKLLLLHAYANLGEDQAVIQYAATMIDTLRQLAPERQQAFVQIIEDAYRHLGREQEAATFKHRVGL